MIQIKFLYENKNFLTLNPLFELFSHNYLHFRLYQPEELKKKISARNKNETNERNMNQKKFTYMILPFLIRCSVISYGLFFFKFLISLFISCGDSSLKILL
jgi:hypothetical protein